MSSEAERREWEYVRRTLVQCQQYLESTGVRHTWIDSAIDICAARANEEPALQQSEAVCQCGAPKAMTCVANCHEVET